MSWKDITLAIAVAGTLFAPASGGPIPEEAPTKFARGRNGMVATGSPYATAAAVRILEAGGNAIDAAAAAHLALMVADPANASVGGRTQILLRLSDGRVIAIDGATQTPSSLPRLAGPADNRQGYAVIPVPGNLAALEEMVGKYGRLPLAEVLRPSVDLAETGYKIPARLAATWARTREALSHNPGAARNFLHADGSAYREGEVFRQPQLANTLRQIAGSGVKVFYRGSIAQAIARDVGTNGGFLQQHDLETYRARQGVVVRTTYRGFPASSAGGRAWGDTLAEMLNILDRFPIGRADASSDEIEILARVMAQALDDRPQEIGSLKPKPKGYPLSVLSAPVFAAERAELIRKRMTDRQAPPSVPQPPEPHDTTHLSVMDAEGNTVALTTSIGPSFGSRIATPELGFLYAHSYRMRADPTPGSRDETEMTPTILFGQDRPLLALGAAGSELIPTAILQVISNVIDRGYSLERALSTPRIFSLGPKIRLQQGFPASLASALRARGFEVDPGRPDATWHFGLVQAVQYDPATGDFFGAADPLADGAAAGPSVPPAGARRATARQTLENSLRTR